VNYYYYYLTRKIPTYKSYNPNKSQQIWVERLVKNPNKPITPYKIPKINPLLSPLTTKDQQIPTFSPPTTPEGEGKRGDEKSDAPDI